MGTFLEEYSKYSPGIIHLSYMVGNCIDSGIEYFDHLRGAYDYKNSWADGAVKLYKYNQRCSHLPAILRTGAYDILKGIKGFPIG